jgi:hypothetical protein
MVFAQILLMGEHDKHSADSHATLIFLTVTV